MAPLFPVQSHGGPGGSVMERGRGRGRGGTSGSYGGGRQTLLQQVMGQRISPGGHIHSTGRILNSVLVLRNVPAEKLTLGSINEYFQQFGKVLNIQIRPAVNPDHAFVEFSQRSEGQAAFDSVEALMGNRHVRAYWARESDYQLDGIPLAGVEFAPSSAVRKPFLGQSSQQQPPQQQSYQQHQQASQQQQKSFQRQQPVRPPAAPTVEEDPTVVMLKKREMIAAAKLEQAKAKTQRAAEHSALLDKQKALFAKLNEGCTPDEKKTIFMEIKAVAKSAEELLKVIKIKDVVATAPPVNPVPAAVSGAIDCTATPPATAGRSGASPRVGRGPMQADFRPKMVEIRGATAEGLNEQSILLKFRDMESAKLVDDIWVLDFKSRYAAEAAIRDAVAVLDRGFGEGATIAIAGNKPATTKPASLAGGAGASPAVPNATSGSSAAQSTAAPAAMDPESAPLTATAATAAAGDGTA
jgi:hypothetical protein